VCIVVRLDSSCVCESGAMVEILVVPSHYLARTSSTLVTGEHPYGKILDVCLCELL